MSELKKDSIIKLEIVDLGFEGKAIGRTDGDFVVFVDSAVPGDVINAKIKKIKKNYAEATCENILTESQSRTIPKCEYFGTCNGCKMQNIKYEVQLDIKRNSVKNAFERLGGFTNINIPNVLGSESIYFYRNKLEFSFSNNKWLTKDDLGKQKEDINFSLGFHIPKFIDKVLDIKKCYLQSENSNKILNLTREFFKQKEESIYSPKSHSGFLRFLVIRHSHVTNEILANLITSEYKENLIIEFGQTLKHNIPEINTLIYTISSSKAQVAIGEQSLTIFGDGFINDKIGKYDFKITPNTFFQTNSLQAKLLFDTLIKISDLNEYDNVLDLYCGCGAISLYISEYVNRILGIELSHDSIDSAKENAALNGVTNCEFLSFDVKDYLKILTSEKQKEFNTIILDPPRSGIHPKAAQYLLEYEAPKIIYVSCNPTTQARDVKLLSEKYIITSIQPVDMFPHTFHIENICILELKKNQSY